MNFYWLILPLMRQDDLFQIASTIATSLKKVKDAENYNSNLKKVYSQCKYLIITVTLKISTVNVSI